MFYMKWVFVFILFCLPGKAEEKIKRQSESCEVEIQPKLNLVCKGYVCEKSSKPQKKFKIDLSKNPKNLAQTLELIALTERGQKMLDQVLPAVWNKEIAFKEASEVAKKEHGVDQKDNAFYEARETPKALYINLESEVGILAADIYHEMFHSRDRDLHICDDKSYMTYEGLRRLEDPIPALLKNAERFDHLCSFNGERLAYNDEFEFLLEMEKVIPCYKKYSLSNNDFQSVGHKMSDEEIIKTNKLNPEYFKTVPSEYKKPNSR